MLRLRNKLLPLCHLKEFCSSAMPTATSGFVVVIAGRQPGVRHRRRRRVPHRGNRHQADVVEAAAHRGIFRHHHPRRRLGHHDHRSEWRRASARPRRARRHGRGDQNRKQSEETAADETVALLVFRAGSQQPKAVPLSLVTRLEEIDCRRIEISDGRHLVQYRDQLMPLLRIDTDAELKQEGAQPILVFSDHGRSMGLVVDEIVDIVEDKLDIEVGERPPRHARLCRGQGRYHRDHRCRPLPAAGIRRLVPPPRCGERRGRAQRSAGRRLAPSSATCWRR